MSCDMTTMKPKPKRGRPPKPKGAPCRPLSAYNIFFRDERQRILARIKLGDAAKDYVANSEEAIASLQGKKTGVIKFQAIARTIASRWKALSEDERSPYEDMAAKEMEGYKKKKEEYIKKVGETASTNPNGNPSSNLAPRGSSKISDSSAVNIKEPDVDGEETPFKVVNRDFLRHDAVKSERADFSEDLVPSLILLSRSRQLASPLQGNEMMGLEKKSKVDSLVEYHSLLRSQHADCGNADLEILLVRREQEIRRRERMLQLAEQERERMLQLAEQEQCQRRIWQALTLQQQQQQQQHEHHEKQILFFSEQEKQRQQLRHFLTVTMHEEREKKLRSRFALQQKFDQLQQQELQARLALQHGSW